MCTVNIMGSISFPVVHLYFFMSCAPTQKHSRSADLSSFHFMNLNLIFAPRDLCTLSNSKKKWNAFQCVFELAVKLNQCKYVVTNMWFNILPKKKSVLIFTKPRDRSRKLSLVPPDYQFPTYVSFKHSSRRIYLIKQGVNDIP